MAVSDPIWGPGAGGDNVEQFPGNRPALTVARASLRAGTAIPPREWLYGTMLLKRYVSVLVSPGGVGKTALTIGIAISAAVGRRILGDWVHSPTNVLVCNLEDPEDEFDRRVAAFIACHRIDAAAMSGQIWTINGRDRHLILASLDADRTTVIYPDKTSLVETIRDKKIGLIVVDPFVNSHELDENSNAHINAAVRAWAEIANETGCAVLLVHHTRKGAVAGDIDSARGASALLSAARVGLTLAPMSEDEAKQFGLPPNDRRRYVRLDDAKANLSPPSERARWFKLASVALGNQTAEYPSGDNVQAITVWEPPSIWAEHTGARLNEVLDTIAAGPSVGGLYLASNRGKGGSSSRWVGNVLIDMLSIEEEQAKQMLSAWFKSGLLTKEEFRCPEQRRLVPGVSVDDSKRPAP